jgi:hypothetical protein
VFFVSAAAFESSFLTLNSSYGGILMRLTI